MSLYAAAQFAIGRLAHRFDPQVLQAMLHLPALHAESFADAAAMAGWTQALERQLATQGLGKPRYRANAQIASETHPGALVVQRQHHGLEVTQTFPAGLFESGELLRDAQWLRLALNIGGQNAVGFAALLLGSGLGRIL